MTTYAEHMRADFNHALNECGKSVVIDGGDPILVFVGPVQTMPGEFDRQNVLTKNIFHREGDLEIKVPDQLVTVDGERWQVMSHRSAGVSVCLSLQRTEG